MQTFGYEDNENENYAKHTTYDINEQQSYMNEFASSAFEMKVII